MSMLGKRGELAAALGSVPGIRGLEKRPPAPNVGDAWPLFARGDRDAGDAFLNTWLIRVLCPQDEDAASDWWDRMWPQIYFALKPVAIVDAHYPVLVPVSGVDQLAYEISVRAEE